MISIDEKDYPVIVVTMDGEITLDDVQTYTQALEAVFARGTPCGLIWISTDHTIISKEARSLQARWLKQQKPHIAESCRGFAWVLKSQAQLLLYKPMLALQGKRMMGCPSAAFGNYGAALSWVQAQLA